MFERALSLGRCMLLISLLSIMALGISLILISYIFKLIISNLEMGLQGDKTKQILTLLCLTYVFLVLLKEIVSIFRSTIYSITSRILLFDMQSTILEKFKKIDFKIFYTQKFQDLYFGVLNNYNSECFQMITTTISLLCSLVELASVLAILLVFDFKIFILLVVFTTPSVWIRCKTQEKFIGTIKQNATDERKSWYMFHILTDKDYLKEIRSFSLEKYFGKKRSEVFNLIIGRWKKFGKSEFFRVCLSQFVSSIGLFVAIYKIVLSVSSGEITISNFVFYCTIILSFKNSIGQIAFLFSESYRGVLFINQLFEFFKFEEVKNYDDSPNNKLQLKAGEKYTIEFKGVSFRYCDDGKSVLENINLKFNPGEKICIIGKNGCGKSTLTNLLLRHYHPTSGQILLNGKNIYLYNLKEYKKLFSGIYQDFRRYFTSVKSFISFGDIERENEIEDIKTAARKSLSTDFIENYENYLSKMFEKNGLELSGGQWQKLALARVFFSSAPILIFDEPTSSLDPVSEKIVFEEISKIKDRTVIFITHRISNLKYADKIVFMDKGVVLSAGKHSDLVKSCKKYKNLIETQK